MAPNGKSYYRVADSLDAKVDALALREIGKQLLQEDGHYILGKEFTAVDVALAPFWHRIHWIGSYYRPQLDFVSTDDPALARLEASWQAVSQRPSVRSTLVCRDRLVASYGDYARNEATSEFAQSMRNKNSTVGS
jgi:glutathione S-transferase